MQRSSLDHYLREVPFLTMPLAIIAVALVAALFFAIPARQNYLHQREILNNLPALIAEKEAIETELDSLKSIFPQNTTVKQLTFTDEASYIETVLDLAREAGVTLTRTSPKSEGNAIAISTSFVADYNKVGTFLRTVEQFPLQLSVTQLALKKVRSSLDVSITITGYTEEENQ